MPEDPYRASKLSLEGARALARARAEASGGTLADDVEEHPWGWVFVRGGPPLPPGPSPLIIVTREGRVDVPSSVVSVERYAQLAGLAPPPADGHDGTALAAPRSRRVLGHAAWIVALFVVVAMIAWRLGLGTGR